MLQQIRNFSKSWISTILLGLLALSFAAWGVGDIFKGGVSNNVAEVGKRTISVDEFQRDWRQELRQRSAMMGGEFTVDMANATGMGNQLLQRSVIRAAIDNVADEMGLKAGDEVVSAQIHAMEVFQGPMGGFDKGTFMRVIGDSGYTEQGFIEAIRTDISRGQLTDAIQDGLQMPADYVTAIFATQQQVRAADYFVIPASAVGKLEAPSDAQLEAYVKAHAASFSTPEYRTVTLAMIRPEDVMGALPAVTEEQVKQLYDSRKATYVIAEKREIDQIVFGDEASAKAARAKIDAGTSFAAIAQERGLKDSEASLGALAKSDMDDARAVAAFAAAENGVTRPVKGPFGWVLMRIGKVTPGATKTLEDVRPELTEDMRKQLAGGKLIDIVNAYQAEMDSGEQLDVAAKKAGMHVIKLASVDVTGHAPDGTALDLPKDPDVLTELFKAEVGEEGDPFQTKAGNFYVAKVDGVTPPKVKPLNEVRAQAVSEWTAQQMQGLLQAKGKELAAQASKDGGLDKVAKAVNATVQKSPGMQRQNPGTIFSQAVIAELFSKLPEVAVSGPAQNGEDYVVAMTTGVLNPPPPTGDPSFQRAVQELSGQLGSDVTLSLANAAQQKQGVKIYRDKVILVTGESQ